MNATEKRKRFRAVLAGPRCLSPATVFDALSARVAESVGYELGLRGLESQHWLKTALKRTVWPFVATGLLVSALGWAMQAYAPEAHSLGQVIKHVKGVEKT